MKSNKEPLLIARMLIGLFILCVQPTDAAEQLITAVFSPDTDNAAHNQFVNTTPNYGYCVILPNQCKGSFSIQFPVTLESSKALDPVEAAVDRRKAAYFSMPFNFRTVQVMNDVTGAVADVKIRISGFGGRYILRDSTWHGHLWNGGSWVYASAPCLYGGVGSGAADYYDFFWKAPVSASTACVKTPKVEIPAPFKYQNMAINYELITPDPLAMDVGTYSGRVTFGIGPGQDFDFGDVMVASDSQITFNFKLAVNHLLKVDFPPGSNRAILQPKEGWQTWLNSGRRAPALNADMAFKMSSSGPFRVYLNCEYDVGNTCGIQAPAAAGEHTVGVDIGVSFANGIVTAVNNLPAIKVPLGIGPANAVIFRTAQIQFSRGATLHYDIPSATTAQMVKNPGRTYRGTATVIFDATI